jgi:hypothetical protein
MRRLQSIPVAIVAVLVSAGIVAAFTTPSAASNGLAIAKQHSGRTVPAFPTTIAAGVASAAADSAAAGVELQAPADLPDAASHGAAVAAVATADDATPDTNHGADVSAVARQNHGQTIAATHRPADAGKPATVGAPEGVGKPADAGPPEGVGRP